jgi:Fe-S oxidoreductase
LGDELDSLRGRIDLIKDMLEKGRPADARTVRHIDRCLSCLACMTTCPSGALKRRKVATLEAKPPDVIAAGNIGCMMQIGSGTGVPVVHAVERLDWATGGPISPRLAPSAP